MRIYLAGENGKWRLIREYGNLYGRRHNGQSISRMAQDSRRKEGRNVYLAGEHPVKNGSLATGGGYILESFYYCRKNEVVSRLLPLVDDFLLDSGAFTFIQNKNGACDWERYIDEYAEWINEHKIEKFFELDIDSIVGLKEVERLRAKLEQKTGKQPIPVWHPSRGKDYFLQIIKDYKYCALGGIAINKNNKKFKDYYENTFPWFIEKAHEENCKLHGLGYTSIKGLKINHFDSVDSTAWLYGNRSGTIYRFNPQIVNFEKVQVPPGYRLKSQEAAIFNYMEWRKFQKFADKYL